MCLKKNISEGKKALSHLVLYQIPPSLGFFFNPPEFLEIIVL